MRLSRLTGIVCVLLFCFTQSGCAVLSDRLYELRGDTLWLHNDDVTLRITARADQAFVVEYQSKTVAAKPSYAILPVRKSVVTRVEDNGQSLAFYSGKQWVKIDKATFRLSFYRGSELLIAQESGFFATPTLRGVRFSLSPDEKLFGGGQRVLMDMDRRGHILPLYNKPSYGYSTEALEMYFSVPALLSSNNYLLLFDNAGRGALDVGASEKDILQLQSTSGDVRFAVVTGNSLLNVVENYTGLTGRQPMPPRWVFGNFASRFGYHTEKEVRDVVAAYERADIPLDAIVLDIFWFGPDIKGHMGNLAWDKAAFPRPEKMLGDFKSQGVHTVLVTEPFILSTSKRWDEAVEADVLAKNLAGEPKNYEFYFGNTGLIDVFKPAAKDWFWRIYKDLIEQGVEGIWGDLGEPEAHPDDTVHVAGMAEEIHNVFGHEWAKLVFQRHTRDYPKKRPMILMRSGYAGSQRYGMIPWTGDVARDWGGLQSQVELMLQMSLMGLAYTHSDLGGFAGGETFDPELYIRWLQLGVFSPVFRPHGQEHIASEPVFHGQQIIAQARDLINWRYRLLPYNYTLAFDNSQRGVPFARPTFFIDQENKEQMHLSQSYMWGDAFLVAPVVKPDVNEKTVYLPKGAWFDYYTGKRFDGGGEVVVKLSPTRIPLWVKAGAFVPEVPDMKNTSAYTSEFLTLSYYADDTVKNSCSKLYEDDGKTRGAFENDQYEILHYCADRMGDDLKLRLSKSGRGYKGAPQKRVINAVVKQWLSNPASVAIQGSELAQDCVKKVKDSYCYDEEARELSVQVEFDGSDLSVDISGASNG